MSWDLTRPSNNKNQTINPTIRIGRGQFSYGHVKKMVDDSMPDRQLTLYLTSPPKDEPFKMSPSTLREAIKEGRGDTINNYFPETQVIQELHRKYYLNTGLPLDKPVESQILPRKTNNTKDSRLSQNFVPEKIELKTNND